MDKARRKRVTTVQLFDAISEVKDRLGSVELTTAAIFDELMGVKATVELHEARFTKLEGLMWRRFDAIDDRFDGMDRRFDGMDRRFDAMDRRFDEMEQRFDARFDRLDARVGVLEVRPAP
jgi:flagellar capping protein FliD